jgi:hypothetical protein
MTKKLNIIPSEIEPATEWGKSTRPGFQSRGETEEQFRGIVRLRFASLRMTICFLHSVSRSAPDIRHPAFLS